MIAPNFSESQLQMLTNIEIFNRFGGLPAIPTLREENRLGWDSGWCFPWLGPAHRKHKGCNFFIQYKLSNMFNSLKSLWGQPFFRFNLGYKRNRSWDVAQRNHLIKLAVDGFTVMYVTNHLLEFVDLAALFQQGTLTSTLPVLPVEKTISKHKQVSFTAASTFFRLHTKEETSPKQSISKLFEIRTVSDIEEDLEKIIAILIHYEEAVGVKESTIRRELARPGENNKTFRKAFVAFRFLQCYLNLYWLRI